MPTLQTIKRGTPLLVRQWSQAVVAAGGGFTPNSLTIACRLTQVLQTKSYYGKIRYLLPLLGIGINAARVPLIDAVGAGTATNVNFVNGDFSQSTGLQGDGSTKRFDLGFTGAALGAAGNGAVGYWSLAMGTVGDWVIGERNTDLFGIYLNSALAEGFYWGSGGSIDTTDGSSTNGHYYGQRTPANIRLFKSGAQVAINGVTTGTGNIGASNMNLMAIDAAFLSNGTCGAAYFTDGTLTDGEISDLHATLTSYLMVPTGRI